jgi:hypothetical protein
MNKNRALDETRAELKRELDKRSNVRDEEEFRRYIYMYIYMYKYIHVFIYIYIYR